ncbi:MAG: Uma2 family endonuclease [Chthoniobacteraceae bacterium]
MTELLEVPAIRARAMKFSIEDYHRITEGQPTELLHGTIIRKMSKSPTHSSTAENVQDALEGQVKPPLLVLYERPLALTDSEPEPDVCVVRGTKADFARKHPATAELVVEIAVTTLEIDRVKALIYAAAGVKEYWIVCPEEKRVEVFRQPGAQGYAETLVVSAPAVLASTALPGVQIDLAAFFA